jgi:hypothetical protein
MTEVARKWRTRVTRVAGLRCFSKGLLGNIERHECVRGDMLTGVAFLVEHQHRGRARECDGR